MYRQATADLTDGLQELARTSAGDDWWSLYAPALVVVLCATWVECMPVYTGYGLCVFAVVAVILVTRADRSSMLEKMVWGGIAFILFAGEAAVGYAAHMKAQTFLVCRFAAPGIATVDLHGPTTLRSVTMVIVNQVELDRLRATRTENGDEYAKIYQVLPVGLMAPGLARSFPVRSPKLHDDVAHYRVLFSTETGYWWEDVQAVLVNGRPVQALRVVRYVKGQPATLFEEAERDYPRNADNHIDWGWAAKEP